MGALTMGGRVARCVLQDRPHRLPAFIIRKHSREHASRVRNIKKILYRHRWTEFRKDRCVIPILSNLLNRLPSDHPAGTSGKFGYNDREELPFPSHCCIDNTIFTRKFDNCRDSLGIHNTNNKRPCRREFSLAQELLACFKHSSTSFTVNIMWKCSFKYQFHY